MSACAFCFGPLLPTFTQGLPRERCGRCASVWFEGETLTKLVGGSAADSLLQRARGQHGQCKGCQAPLAHVAQCPDCGRDAPTCPQCGVAPLGVAKVLGVEVDVCTQCHGVALDAGELETLQRLSAAEREESFDLKPRLAPERLARPECAACRRKLQLEHAFTLDDKLYCGSCAPVGCAPYDVELTRATPSMIPSAGARYLKGGTDWTAPDPLSIAIGWLFSKLGG